MILPHPESDLSLNILILGSEIIEYLKKSKNYIFIEETMKEFLNRNAKRTPELFLDALTFLYMAGCIEYKGYKVRLRQSDFTS